MQSFSGIIRLDFEQNQLEPWPLFQNGDNKITYFIAIFNVILNNFPVRCKHETKMFLNHNFIRFRHENRTNSGCEDEDTILF